MNDTCLSERRAFQMPLFNNTFTETTVFKFDTRRYNFAKLISPDVHPPLRVVVARNVCVKQIKYSRPNQRSDGKQPSAVKH